MRVLFDLLNRVSAEWILWMWQASMQLFLFGGVVLLLSWLLRNRPARFLYWLWFAVIVQALLPPRWPTALFLKTDIGSNLPAIMVTMPEIVLSGEPGANSSDLALTSVLLLFWLSAVMGLSVYVLGRNLRFWSRLKWAQDFPVSRMNNTRHGCTSKLRIKRLPWNTVPFSWGLLKPTIFLPADAVNWSSRELEIVLAHERGHIRSGDLWLALPLLVAQVLFFHHPVIWLAVRKLEILRESACDDQVLEEIPVDPLEYGRFLLRHLSNARGNALGPVVVHCLHLRKSLQVHRFRYLIKRRNITMKRKPFSEVLLLGLVLLLAFTLPMVKCSKKEPVKPQEGSSAANAKLQVLPKAVNYDVPPKPKGGNSALRNKIMFPQKYRTAGYNATLLASIQIDQNGKVLKVALRPEEGKTVPAELKREIEQSIKHSQWIPAQKDGRAVPATVFVPIVLGKNALAAGRISFGSREVRKSLFVPYDQPPEPVGGFKAVQRNLVYPEKARKEQVEGTVIVHVLIDEQGKVVNSRILESLSPECDQAAIEALKKPHWRAARQDNKPVKVWVSVPVMFRLRK